MLPVDVTGEGFVLPDGAGGADAVPQVRGLVQISREFRQPCCGNFGS